MGGRGSTMWVAGHYGGVGVALWSGIMEVHYGDGRGGTLGMVLWVAEMSFILRV